jgi:hypothetical protein
VAFRCHIGDRVLDGIVKEKEQANKDFDEAVRLGQGAGLLQQSDDVSDVFRTSLGNVPADASVTVEITFVGEFKQDVQSNSVRYVLPTAVAARYGNSQDASRFSSTMSRFQAGTIRITVDVLIERGNVIRSLESPSHPYQTSLGRTSTMTSDSFEPHAASATASIQSQGSSLLGQDFVMLVNAQGHDSPVAFFESHPTLPNQRALMTSLVPKFSLPNISPEIVFIIDRSGSMCDKIETLQKALKVFLKSLPVGVSFNICSFGSRYEFLWDKSKRYSAGTLEDALLYVDSIRANMGGTRMYEPVKATVEKRLKDLELEVLLLTDGEIWNQEELFRYINTVVSETPSRFFSLGIGHSASSALIEGIARAGEGFAQTVLQNEELDRKVVRMLKGALTPHIKDYSVSLEYPREELHGFEIIEHVDSAPSVELPLRNVRGADTAAEVAKTPISLLDTNFEEAELPNQAGGDRFEGLPPIDAPKYNQVPMAIPQLYPLFRTTVYFLLSSETDRVAPQTLIVRGTSNHGPLELRIPINDVGKGETIHQLAARRAVQELEEGRDWLSNAKMADGRLVKYVYESKWSEIVAREGVRLGTTFQIASRWTSFVALEKDSQGKITSHSQVDQAKHQQSWPSYRPATQMMQAPQFFSAGSLAPPSAAYRWHGRGGVSSSRSGNSASRSPMASFEPTRGSASLSRSGPGSSLDASINDAGRSKKKRASRGHDESQSQAQQRDVTPPPPDKLHALINLQSFEGFWEWNSVLFNALALDQGFVTQRLADTASIEPTYNIYTPRILATTLAIVFLEKKAAHQQDVWVLIAEKARTWLSKTLKGPGVEESLKSSLEDSKTTFAQLFGQRCDVA